ncbi:MAG TPA: DUF2339 domain-containing protein [Bacteriovoracaceae bacterium]|nr:DUF2339 domain-containing protein [Bacteriovoracaceae bacterium]
MKKVAERLPLPNQKPEEASNLLGIVGVCCLIVAMILLIKFSIDSGWLTPMRQLILAALFGGALITTPVLVNSKDRSYLSLLPATGVVVLHLTVYGAIFYHTILPAIYGIWLVGAIGLLSLWLLEQFQDEIYAVMAIAGTYLGCYFLVTSFNDLKAVALYVLVWDVVFSLFALRLKNRSLIFITAYFSLGLVAFLGLTLNTTDQDWALQLAVIQILQILIISVFTMLFTVKNKTSLTEEQAWQLFPVYLFFYGTVFYYLDIARSNSNLAIGFSLTTGLVILGLQKTAQGQMRERLESSPAIYTYVTLLFYHSVYFVLLNESGKLAFTLGLMVVVGFLGERLKKNVFWGASLLSLLVIGYSVLLLVTETPKLSQAEILGYGFSYGAILLTYYGVLLLDFFLAAGSFLIVLTICRLNESIGEIWIGPLCVAYAFACLLVAFKKNNKQLAKSAFPVIFFAIGRFVFFNFGELSQGEQIISLLAMGGLIYAGGFVYRKVIKES